MGICVSRITFVPQSRDAPAITEPAEFGAAPHFLSIAFTEPMSTLK
jgi:hypothetical protein